MAALQPPGELTTRAPRGRRSWPGPRLPAALLALGLLLSGCTTVSREAEVTTGPDAPSTAPSLPDGTGQTAGSPSATLSPSAGVLPSAGGTPAPDDTPPSPGDTPSPQRTPSAGAAGPLGDPSPPASTPPAAASPSASPDAARIGYISLDDSIPFSRAVRDGVRDEALQAGLEVVACDARWTRAGAMACTERLVRAGVGGIVSFQPFADVAAGVCASGRGIPVVGVVFDQGPCQVSLLEIDQAESGRLAGSAVGRFARQRWDCQADAFISLESSDADPAGRARMQGYRDGYRESCALPLVTIAVDEADRLATARTVVGRLLETVRGDRIIVTGLNEDAILGAIAAASAVGRADDLWYSGQLADPSIRQTIACDEHYIASVAQFPERFGGLLVPTLIDAMAGTSVPASLDAPLELVDAGNVRELFPDTPACDA